MIKLIVEWTVSLRVLQSHLLLDFSEALHGKVDILLGVPCGDLGTDPIFASRHDRVAERHDVDTFFKHPTGKFVSDLGVVEHDRNDGVFTGELQ